MGEAVERLLALARVVVPPYVREHEGHIQHVEGYTYERDLTLPQPEPVTWLHGSGVATGAPEVTGPPPVQESRLDRLLRIHPRRSPEVDTYVSPIHRGPGPVMTREEAEEWSRDSALPGPWYHGGTGRSGLGARIWERSSPLGYDSFGRAYYVTDQPGVAGGYGGSTGVTREVYLKVEKPLRVGGPEYDAILHGEEVAELMAQFPGLERVYAVQVVAQRHGYDAVYLTKTPPNGAPVTTVGVFDARKAAIVEADVRDPLDRMYR